MTDLQEAVDALAEYFGVELRLKHDDAAPMPFAVWCWEPFAGSEENADIIGAGQTESEALDAARVQLREWEERA